MFGKFKSLFTNSRELPLFLKIEFMDKELLDRLDKIEKQLGQKRKDFWEKIQVLTPILIPLSIALIGWYFTREYNYHQLEMQKINNENQLQVAIINSNVGQSQLIKGFMENLTSKDTAARNIAIEAILYAAPTPGKRIVELMAKSGDVKTKEIANDALSSKRIDLVDNLFSTQKQVRLIAANEITSNWNSDETLLNMLIKKSGTCLISNDSSPDCENGVFNTLVVLSSFSKNLLANHKNEVVNLISKIPTASKVTTNQGKELLKQVE